MSLSNRDVNVTLMGFTPIGSIVKKGIESAGLKGPVEAAQVCEAYDRVVLEMFGDKLKDKTKALYLKNRTLTVSASSAVVGQELKLHEAHILEKVNAALGSKVVERLRFLA